MGGSTHKTSLGLNQWVSSDKPTMSDFNEDNRIVDREITGHAGNRNNPHNTTAAQVGAAPASHAHPASQVTGGAFPRDASYVVSRTTDEDLNVASAAPGTFGVTTHPPIAGQQAGASYIVYHVAGRTIQHVGFNRAGQFAVGGGSLGTAMHRIFHEGAGAIVNTAHIADGAITQAKLQNAQIINNARIATNAVDARTIADGAITASKFAIPTLVTDANLASHGRTQIRGNSPNAPMPGGDGHVWIIDHMVHHTNWIRQIAYPVTMDAPIRTRQLVVGVWGAWTNLI